MQLVALLTILFFVNLSIFVRANDVGNDSPIRHNIPLQNHNELWKEINELKQKLNYQEQELNDLKKNMSDQQQKIAVQQETIRKLPTFCQGKTSYDQWKPYADIHSIVVYVNTTFCRFKQTPTYFTSLSGNTNHWKAIGMTSIYDETSTGFTVFLFPELGQESQGQTMELLAVRKWELNWIGIVQGEI